MSFKQDYFNYYAGNRNGIERAGNCYTGEEYNCGLDADERKELKALHANGEHLGAPTSHTGSLKYNEEKNRWEVWSYWTLVAYFKRDENGEWTFTRTWNDWSKTTASHIDEARSKFGFDKLPKKLWLQMEVEEV